MPGSETERLARGFHGCTLPREEFTHRAHLQVGLWNLLQFPADVALDRLREGIRRFNESVGGTNTATSGYHETITRFYVWAIGRFLDGEDRSRPIDELAEELVARIGDREFPMRYYSRDRLMSSEARLAWVEPDRTPLD